MNNFMESYKARLKEITNEPVKYDLAVEGKTVSQQMESILTSGIGDMFEKHGMHLSQQNFTDKNGKTEVGIGLTYDSVNYPDMKLPVAKFDIVKNSITKSIKKMQLDFAMNRPYYAQLGKEQMKVNNERVTVLREISMDISEKAYEIKREKDRIKYLQSKNKAKSLKPKTKGNENNLENGRE